MIKIGDIGRFESLPQILNDVLNENISALQEHLLNGWEINKAISFHQMQNKLDELRPYTLPKKIIEFLNGENLHFNLADSDFVYLEFFKLIDTIPFKFGKQKLLRLSRSLGDYNHIYIVWDPKTKKIASYDMEHEELIDLAGFDDFIENMTKYMNLILE